MSSDKIEPSGRKRLPSDDEEVELPAGLTRLTNGLLVSEDAASDDLVRYASTLQWTRVEADWIMGDLVLALEKRGATDVCESLERGVWSKSRLGVARRVAFRFP